MTIAVISNVKSQVRRHQAVTKTVLATAAAIHTLACEDIMFVRGKFDELGQYIPGTGGDVSLCQDLAVRLGLNDNGKSHSPVRVESLKSWFLWASGNQIVSRNGVWGMVKGWSPDKFVSEAELEKTTFFQREAEKKTSNFSLVQILKSMRGFTSRIEKAQKEGKFDGDANKALAIVTNAVNLAEVEASRLTAQEKGVILKFPTPASREMEPAPTQPAAIVAATAMQGLIDLEDETEVQEDEPLMSEAVNQ